MFYLILLKKLSKFQKGNGVENSNIDNPSARSSITSRAVSLSSDEDMLEVKHQSSSQQAENNQFFERSIRVDDAASHCKYIRNILILFYLIVCLYKIILSYSLFIQDNTFHNHNFLRIFLLHNFYFF